jgi:hypothetical protein
MKKRQLVSTSELTRAGNIASLALRLVCIISIVFSVARVQQVSITHSVVQELDLPNVG